MSDLKNKSVSFFFRRGNKGEVLNKLTKMKLLTLIISLILLQITTSAQQIIGHLKYHINQPIKLMGYQAFKTINLAQSTIDSTGSFVLNYKNYKGMAYLEITDKDRLFLIINEPNIKIEGNYLQQIDSVFILNSKENELFTTYSTEHYQRESALAGWKYLLPLYQTLGQLNQQQQQQVQTQAFITNEINRLQTLDSIYLNNIDKNTYASWYLPIRKLIDDMPLSAQRYTERIPSNLNTFRNIDFNNPNFITSGIIDDVIQGHYLLLENMGLSMDSMYSQMNLSTDYLIANLEGNNELLNETSRFLFNLFEKRSLFRASEYLSLKMLTQNSCVLNHNLAQQMETYRAMKVGNTAADIFFTGDTKNLNVEQSEGYSLSQINNKYTLVVFGASWCHKCTQEIPKLKQYYNNWKNKGVEIVFVSIDTDKEKYDEFVKDFEWISTCDFKGWENIIVKNYYVFSTPTMFLLNKDLKILLRPISIEQVDAWVKYKLKNSGRKQSNKVVSEK